MVQSQDTTAASIESQIKASVKNIVNIRKYSNDNPLEVRAQLAGSDQLDWFIVETM